MQYRLDITRQFAEPLSMEKQSAIQKLQASEPFQLEITQKNELVTTRWQGNVGTPFLTLEIHAESGNFSTLQKFVEILGFDEQA